jgi:mannose-6-phosphate isomerase-like protein (cupin superfamily)
MAESRVIAKAWGGTEPLVITPMFELHRLYIEPMMRCSFHVHRFKHNAFYVLDGQLFIDMADKDLCFPEPRGEYSQDGTVRLREREYLTIKPGVHHQFRTNEVACTALEMYFTEPLSEDIVRRNVGGPA